MPKPKKPAPDDDSPEEEDNDEPETEPEAEPESAPEPENPDEPAQRAVGDVPNPLGIFTDTARAGMEAMRSDGVAGNTLITGNTIDRAGYNSVTFTVHTGTLTTPAATYAFTMEHGDQANMSDAAAVTAANNLGLTGALPSFDGNADNSTFKFGYAGSKRYVRLKCQPTGSVGAASISATASF